MTQTTLLFAALLIISSSAFAGEISKDGSSIEVENSRCVVTSSRRIECMNIGRVCESARVKQTKQNEYYFGCALDEWKEKHPKEKCLDNPYHVPLECMTMIMWF